MRGRLGIADMDCPECGAELQEYENRYPSCEDCGFELLSPEAIALRDATRIEFEQAKRECWPEPVPTYREWVERKVKP